MNILKITRETDIILYIQIARIAIYLIISNKMKDFPTYFAVITCYIGAVSVIYINGFTSPTLDQLEHEGLLNYYTLPVFASIMHVTKIIGLILLPCLVQTNISINVIVVADSIVGAFGWILVKMAEAPLTLIFGVGLVGLYNGITSVFLITYLPEVCLEAQRRLLCGGLGFSDRIGMFCVFLFGIWLSFRWLAVVGLGSVVLFACLMVCNPHSPVWFVRQGLKARAVSTLRYLHGASFDADNEIQIIHSAEADARFSWKNSFLALKQFKVLKPIVLVTSLAIFSALGGHAAMVSYSSQILKSQHGMDPNIASLFYPIFLILGGVASLFTLKCFKLKRLLIVASSLQSLSHLSMAIYFLVYEHKMHCVSSYSQLCRIISFWPVCNIAVYAFSFSIGYGAVMFSLKAVIFKSHREISCAISEIAANITTVIVVYSFYYLLSSIGGFSTFLVFSFIDFISVVFIHTFLQV